MYKRNSTDLKELHVLKSQTPDVIIFSPNKNIYPLWVFKHNNHYTMCFILYHIVIHANALRGPMIGEIIGLYTCITKN